MTSTAAKVDLYNNAYGKYELDLYRQIRTETYGEDLGQTSWVTTEESDEIPELLDLTRESSVLEIGCGSGKYAIRLAERIGCRVTGLDINEHGICNASAMAEAAGLNERVHFQTCDVAEGLKFSDSSFDAVFSNDAICHMPGRQKLLQEIYRILKPGGRLLFSDALVIGGLLSHEELAARSSIGYYVFSPPGENERLINIAGFHLVTVRNTSAEAAAIALRWRQAREARKSQLIGVEAEVNFEGLQRFLNCVHTLTSEKRLLRYLYVARKEA